MMILLCVVGVAVLISIIGLIIDHDSVEFTSGYPYPYKERYAEVRKKNAMSPQLDFLDEHDGHIS